MKNKKKVHRPLEEYLLFNILKDQVQCFVVHYLM